MRPVKISRYLPVSSATPLGMVATFTRHRRPISSCGEYADASSTLIRDVDMSGESESPATYGTNVTVICDTGWSTFSLQLAFTTQWLPSSAPTSIHVPLPFCTSDLT